MSTLPPIVDLVFVSNAKDNRIKKKHTQQAINTAKKGANGLNINCIVIESQPYNLNAVTYNPDRPFNYNYLNFGAEGERRMVFEFDNLVGFLMANIPVVSPFHKGFQAEREFTRMKKDGHAVVICPAGALWSKDTFGRKSES